MNCILAVDIVLAELYSGATTGVILEIFWISSLINLLASRPVGMTFLIANLQTGGALSGYI
jgi:hypothetical protein